MVKLILYLLECSAISLVLYAMYFTLLKKETFFNLSRFFLMAILIFSLTIPLISYKIVTPGNSAINQSIEEISEVRQMYFHALNDWTFEEKATQSNSIVNANTKIETTRISILIVGAVLIYSIGVVVLLIRLLWIYYGVYRLKRQNPKERIEGTTVVKLPYQIASFSFMNSVFVANDLLDSKEFDHIFEHEKVHLQQNHSIDLLIVQLLAIVLWFNPVVWLLIKSLKTTHEYIADKKMINQGYSLVEYQSLLLRQLISNNSFGLVHNFNLSFIKKRITMMKTKESGLTGKVKVAIVLSVFAAISFTIIQCNSKLEEPVLLTSSAYSIGDSGEGINLPVLPQTLYKFEDNPSKVLEIKILSNKITINGELAGRDDIPDFIQKIGFEADDIIVLKVDKDQSMKLVEEVQDQLRKADRRKVLYVGQTIEGIPIQLPMVLPPHPDSETGKIMPKLDDEYAMKHNLSLLKVDMGMNNTALQEQLYDFVKQHVSQNNTKYVIDATFDAEDKYNEFLMNVMLMKEGFFQIYQERTKEMFGKNFYELDKNDETEKFQHMQARIGVPMNLSISIN